MTTIYTKPQLDAIAVKLGNKIKEAKTAVTQEQGQSTTQAVSQKLFTDTTDEINLTIDSINTKQDSHISLRTDENNHVIGQGKAESATVYDLSLRSDKVRVSAPTDVEFGDLVFKTYDAPTVVNGVTIPKGTFLNPALVVPLLGAAATCSVGTGGNQVIDASMAFFSANTKLNAWPDVLDCNTFTAGTRYYINNGNGQTTNLPPVVYTTQVWLVETIMIASGGTLIQYATHGVSGDRFRRTYWSGITSGWTEWLATSANKQSYDATTAVGANVVVTSSGKLMRSTSSERYKDILSPLELDDARYADAMALKPIVYRSTADADNPAYHYYSFSAEELGAYDPAFTLWRETETVTDADGITTEQPLAERQAEGININALLAMSHAIAIKQGELIKDLQEQINALKPQTEV